MINSIPFSALCTDGDLDEQTGSALWSVNGTQQAAGTLRDGMFSWHWKCVLRLLGCGVVSSCVRLPTFRGTSSSSRVFFFEHGSGTFHRNVRNHLQIFARHQKQEEHCELICRSTVLDVNYGKWLATDNYGSYVGKDMSCEVSIMAQCLMSEAIQTATRSSRRLFW
jgi:hypothetical protein